MDEHRRAVTIWAAALLSGMVVVATFVHDRWLELAGGVFGVLAFVALVMSGWPDLMAWGKGYWSETKKRKYRPGPAFTSRWRHTSEGATVTFSRALPPPRL